MYLSVLRTDNPDKAKVDFLASLIANQRSITESAIFGHFSAAAENVCDNQKKLGDTTIDEIVKSIGQKSPPPHVEGPPPRKD